MPRRSDVTTDFIALSRSVERLEALDVHCPNRSLKRGTQPGP